MRRGIFAFTVTAILFFTSAAMAARFSTSRADDGTAVITLSGEIVEGDADDFQNALQTADDEGRTVSLLKLNSPGGNIAEAVKIADLIRDRKLVVTVPASAKCASACFILFAAGRERSANYTSLIGVHGASDESGRETVRSNAATISMARLLKDLGVPPAIIGKMVVTPPDQIVWLTPEELRSMGTTMVGNPIPVVAEPHPQSPPSSQPNTNGTPTASRTTVPPTTARSWEKLIDRAIELSSQQHNGTPDIQRICQSETKECVNGISYKAPDGVAMVMKVTEDMTGKTLRREVCSFSTYGDVRSCIDWDTGVTHRDMKNKDGDWYRID